MKTFYLCFTFCFFQIVLCESECEEEWHQFEDKCFRYHNDLAGANFHDAMAICEYSYEATPVTIRSQQEFEFLTSLVFEKNHAKYSVWIGLVRVSNHSFVWIDRTPLNYTNWGPNEPNNWHSKNYCAVMSSASTAKGKWFDVGCTTTYLVMCQKYLTKTTNQTQNDSDSIKTMADQINMELDIIDIEDKNELITNQLSSVRTLGNVNIFLTVILFVLLIGSVLKYNYNFTFIRRNRRNSDFSSFGNTSHTNSCDI